MPNAIEGHDTPEVEIFGMQGIPADDLRRHREGLPLVPYKKMKLAQGGLLPLLAAQKGTVPDGPDLNASSPSIVNSTFPPLGTSLSHFAPPLPLLVNNVMMSPSPPLYPPPTAAVAVPVSVNANVSSNNVGRTDDHIIPLSLRIPSSVDPNGKVIPAGIIHAPDLHTSMVNELRVDVLLIL